MNTNLLMNCELFVTNKEILEKVFFLEMKIMNLSGASIFTAEGKIASKEKMEECYKILKDNTNLFSQFRGHVKVPFLCKMALSKDPKKYYDNALEAYQLLKRNSIFNDDYKAMAAMSIIDHVEKEEYETVVDRTFEIYKQMKEKHKWITDHADIPLATLLALSNKNIDTLIMDMETCYCILIERFHNYNAVQTLSQVLALYEGSPNEKCEKVFAVYDALKEENHKYSTGNTLGVLGSLSMLDMSAEQIASDLAEADDLLKTNKGFGNIILGSNQRRMFAAQMVLNTYGKKAVAQESTTLSNVIATTIAIEICMILCMSACVIASTANSH